MKNNELDYFLTFYLFLALNLTKLVSLQVLVVQITLVVTAASHMLVSAARLWSASLSAQNTATLAQLHLHVRVLNE